LLESQFERDDYVSPPSRQPESETQWLEEEPQQSSQPISTETTEYVPWYLRVQPKTPLRDPKHPLADKQKIPELPADPPPLLAALLSHLSIEIGLDHLSLIDLRTLDPPAALGSNLIMLVGTARSEKHLHVSADRFCRWLRSEYKMSPYADGLLGRNELKLKMRRKNRRAKLLANVGSTSPENVDDGIRTGWVCVNVGQIDPDPTAVKAPKQDIEGFVGFGTESDKVTVVVQMFTEEKRAETDLEGLWTKLFERSERKRLHREQEAIEAAALKKRLEEAPREWGVDEDSKNGEDERDVLTEHFRDIDAQEVKVQEQRL
jgi:hypothetical protein